MPELYPGAKWVPSVIQHPDRDSTRGVVIHWTAGDEALSTLNGPNVDVQFCVGHDGQVYQFVPLDSRAWHGYSTANNNTVGIETEGSGEPWTEIQFEQISKLTAWICKRWGIPIVHAHPMGHTMSTFDGIFGHGDLSLGGVDGNNHSDNVPAGIGWDRFLARVKFYAGGGVEPDFYYWEESPHDQGGTGPKVVGQTTGYAKPAIAVAVATAQRALGRAISTVNDGSRTYVLWWAKGTYGDRYRSNPFDTAAKRDQAQKSREGQSGRLMRAYQGQRSLYPWLNRG